MQSINTQIINTAINLYSNCFKKDLTEKILNSQK